EEDKKKLCFFDLVKQKETVLGDVDGYEVSFDQKKMLVSQEEKYAIIDVPTASPLNITDWLDLANMDVKLDYKAERKQIFNEGWRQMRDFFYDPGLHGVNWKALKKKYEPLVAHVNHRADLTAIIGDMIGELGTGHCYVGGGDLPKLKRLPLGLLGA